jgi:DNA-binding SARP family transcriptional activator
VWIGLLGDLVIRTDEEVLQITAGKQRAVLAALAVGPGEAVPADALAEVVWDGTPPASWNVTIRNYIQRLRYALRDAGDCIVTSPQGYLLRAADTEVDLLAFEAECKSGHAASDAGDWPGASAKFAAALGMFRGTPFSGIPSRTIRDTYVPYLDEARLASLAARIDADLQLLPCRAAALVPELQKLSREQPLHERFRAQLMLALYRSGRQADALAAFRQARQVSIGELGVEPGRNLVALHQRMLAADPALLLRPQRSDARPRRPDHRATSALRPRHGTRRRWDSQFRYLTPTEGSDEADSGGPPDGSPDRAAAREPASARGHYGHRRRRLRASGRCPGPVRRACSQSRDVRCAHRHA